MPSTIPMADSLCGPPCETLYIYYLRGEAGHCPQLTGPDFIGNWEEGDCSFLFFSAAAHDRVARFVNDRSDLILQDTFIMPYNEWQPVDGWPLETGGFRICPPWGKAPQPTGNQDPPIDIILDPGVVFGNGCHATTHSCLEALEFICYYHGDKIESAIDIGTGTGLLAIAAAKWGAKQVIGMDLNFLATRTAMKNVGLNHVADRVVIVKGDARHLPAKPADLFIANIHYDIMSQLLDSEIFCKSNVFILSGLLRTPVREIIKKLDKMPVQIIKSWNNDGIWYTLAGIIHHT